MLKFAAISPHPANLIPGVADSQKILLKKTAQSMQKLADDLRKVQPETIIVISPHGPMRYDKFTVNLEEKFQGNFSHFGENFSEYRFYNDLDLSQKLFAVLRRKDLPIELIRENKLDHGSLVPLHFLTQELEKKPKLILLTFTILNNELHFEFGKTLGKFLSQIEKNVALVASADLSHRISQDAPAGFSPYGLKFDETLISLLRKNKAEEIVSLDPEFCEEAGECGLRSILIALGAVSNFRHAFEQLSYENPFGIGYLVGNWKLR